jgi:hypothetical protein
MYEAVTSLLIDILPYAMIGSGVRVGWGIYKAYSSVLSMDISRKRVVAEVLAGILFGIFGGVVLSSAGMITLGTNIGTLISSILGANVIKLIAKKFGWSKKMDVVVSDQQLQFPDLNQRQINAMQYVKANGRITSREYQHINRTNRHTAKYELISMVDAGRLRKVGDRKGTSYVAVLKPVKPKPV